MPGVSASARVRSPIVLVVLVVALALRLYWIGHEIPVLEGDECEYARLAENLVKTATYTGIMEGPELMYPPLLPALIVAGSFVTRNYETAGRLVTLLAGLALILAVFGLARQMYGTRVAFIAATLAACHPVMVALSGVVYSETVYLPLVVGGAYFGLRSLDGHGVASAVWSGACFGLAYLTRPEALFYPCVIVAVALLTVRLRGRSFRNVLVTALLVLVPVAVLAAPYIAFLSRHAGGLRFEGKSAMNYAIGQRRLAGMSMPEATLGLGADLREDGPWLSPNFFVIQAPYPIPFRAAVPYWAAIARVNKVALYEYVVFSPAFGSLLTIGLVTIALFRRPWGRTRLIHEAVLLAIVVGYVVILLGQHEVYLRYLTPLLPFLLVWASKGIDETSRWIVGSARRIAARRVMPARSLGAGACVLLVGVLLVLGVRGITWGSFRDESPRELDLKRAGTWLRTYRPGPKKIMAMEHVAPYYAGGVRLAFPFADGDRALAYVRMKEPDFLVMARHAPALTPYYRDWVERGIPDPAARLVYHGGGPDDREVLIYEWTPRAGGG